jgi:cytoskeletal protein RodZ
LKDIGEKLKKSREEAGLSLEEAAEDLKLDLKKLQNVEDGNKEAFKDIYDLKYYIMDYAKYLGLDYEKLMEEFNEFMFDYTSKIPVAQIEQANKQKVEKKITSPYTMERKKNAKGLLIVMGIVIIVLAITFGIIIISNNNNSSKSEVAALI